MNSSGVLIDWLSFSCKLNAICKSSFTFVKEKYQTKEFAQVFTIYIDTDEFATMTREPRSPILHKDLAIIKVSNHQLYSSHLVYNLTLLINELNISDVKINRLDLALDFEAFENGWKPNMLIKKYLNGDIDRLGRSKFKVVGKNGKMLDYQYLSFGSGSSNQSVKLYNKSREFAEVKEKKHIRNVWNICNLGSDCDVWRLEVCIKHPNREHLDKKTGQIFNLDISSLDNVQVLNSLYYSYVYKLFTFVRASKDTNKARRSRLKLLECNVQRLVRFEVTKVKDATKMDKYLVSRLEGIFSDIREGRQSLYGELEGIKRIIVGKLGLEQYYERVILPKAMQRESEPDYYCPHYKQIARDAYGHLRAFFYNEKNE